MAKRKRDDKQYYHNGRPVSKSTFFRRQRAKSDTSLAASRKRIAAEVAEASAGAAGDVSQADQAGAVDPKLPDLVLDAALQRERVEAFMLFARDKAATMTETIVNLAMPAKVFRAAVLALEKSGY